MAAQRRQGFFARLMARFAPAPPVPDELARARALLVALERGGIPLNPARINAIARDLGLEVRRQAPVEQTVERIRQAVARAAGRP